MSEPPQFLAPPPPVANEGIPRRTSRRRTGVKPSESTFEPTLPDDIFSEPKPRSSRRQAGTAASRIMAEDIIEVPSDNEDAVGGRIEEQTRTEEQRAAIGPSSSHSDEAPTDAHEKVTIEPESVEGLLPEPESQEQEGICQATTDASSQNYEDEQTVAISQRIADGGKLVRRRVKPSSATPNILRFFLALMGVASLTSLYNYKTESAPIGFCESGTKSNEVLETIRTRRAAVEECNQENRTLLYAPSQPESVQTALPPSPTPDGQHSDDSQLVLSESCPALPLLPGPNECAPCPAYASCTATSMTCETGYLLRPHPFLFFLSLPQTHGERDRKSQNTYTLPTYTQAWSSGDMTVSQYVYLALSSVLDGLPGLGPVAFPPRCVEDPRRKRHIGALGKAVEAMLAAERGRRLCAGVGWKEPSGSQAEEAKKWGVEVEALKDKLRRKTAVSDFCFGDK